VASCCAFVLKRSLAISVATPRLERWVTAIRYASPAMARTSFGDRLSLGPRRSQVCSSGDSLDIPLALLRFRQRQEVLSLAT